MQMRRSRVRRWRIGEIVCDARIHVRMHACTLSAMHWCACGSVEWLAMSPRAVSVEASRLLRTRPEERWERPRQLSTPASEAAGVKKPALRLVSPEIEKWSDTSASSPRPPSSPSQASAAVTANMGHFTPRSLHSTQSSSTASSQHDEGWDLQWAQSKNATSPSSPTLPKTPSSLREASTNITAVKGATCNVAVPQLPLQQQPYSATHPCSPRSLYASRPDVYARFLDGLVPQQQLLVHSAHMCASVEPANQLLACNYEPPAQSDSAAFKEAQAFKELAQKYHRDIMIDWKHGYILGSLHGRIAACGVESRNQRVGFTDTGEGVIS